MSGLHQRREGSVAVLQLDDGKANALTHELLSALESGLEQARSEARAVVLLGRPGRFCAGFDLGVMGQGGQAVLDLVGHGARLALRLYESPLPVVIGCTGHALAMGAILLLSADLRVGAEGPFKIGLNEVAIGMTLPHFAIELARERITARYLSRATLAAEIYSPSEAVEAGFLDQLTDAEEVTRLALERAAELAKLEPRALRGTKRRLRAEAFARIRAAVELDSKQVDTPRT
ncbi:MAG: crotonase/enoyl-CoA hydratase family protein [Myxococcota bacterium]